MPTSFPIDDDVLDWLLDGEAAVRFQVRRDLLGEEVPELCARATQEGDAATILAARGPDGQWGRDFYQPKWTSSHYSLLELRDMQIPSDTQACAETVGLIVREKSADGGVNPSGGTVRADVCINGMFLAYACHFGASSLALESVIDFVLGQQMDDGGFNCQANRKGARISSVHSTTSAVDGLAEYLRRGYEYRRADAANAVMEAAGSLLARRLYQNRSTGEPIKAEFTRLHYPARWYFDVLRGLDVLRAAKIPADPRMDDALDVIESRRRSDGRWSAAAQYRGQTHVAYPPPSTANRWITLRALRVLTYYRASDRRSR